MNWFDQCRQDVSYAARTFTRAPGFALLVVLTLALGIGAASSMFSVVNALILHPLPFPNANRLVVIWEKFVNEPDRPPVFDTYRDFENWQRGSHSFERMAPATWSTGGGVMTGAGPAREVLALPVGLDFFPLLGIAPELGRTFESNDLNSACTLVLKYSFWIETFGGQSNIAGRRIQLNQDACTIVGVMPREFAFYPEAAEMWRLITPGSPIVRDPKSTVGVFALLKPGVSIQRAQQEVAAIYKGAPTNDLGTMHVTPVIYPLAEQFAYLTGPTLRLSVAVLFGSVGFVLFIACLNIANLLLGKSVARQKEMAVRAALGSDRARIVRQLLTESLLLAVAGAALGTLAAVAAVHYFRVLKPVALPPGNPVAVNLPVLAFSASLAVLTAVLFGLVPALKASRVDLMEALRVSAQSASLSRAARTFRRALVVAEVALSLALLAGAGLLVESLAKLASVPLGFRTDHLAVIPVNLPHWAYPTASQRARFYGSALDRAALVSGQISAAFANALPPDGQVGRRPLAVEGRPEPTLTPASFNVGQISISPDYFRVMGVRMELGRTFDKADIDKSPAVAIVNDALARQYFPHDNPIGKRIRLPERGADAPWLIIVGVSASEKGQDFFHPMNWQETPIVFRPM
ncbi:MAG: ABC transporter permease, partial [Acidobacteriia bacterium]|nr:ABC transporter permease [Terriglobia bacterium]